MNKKEFLRVLSRSLRGMPRAERAQSLEYYGEMIQDRMEEGLSEEEAVARLGSADEIARMKDCGSQSVTLGPRILRTETAGLCALSALFCLYGELE